MRTEKRKMLVPVTLKVAHLYSVDFFYFLSGHKEFEGTNIFTRFVDNCEKQKRAKGKNTKWVDYNRITRRGLAEAGYGDAGMSEIRRFVYYFFQWSKTIEGTLFWEIISRWWCNYIDSYTKMNDAVVWHWDDGESTVIYAKNSDIWKEVENSL